MKNHRHGFVLLIVSLAGMFAGGCGNKKIDLLNAFLQQRKVPVSGYEYIVLPPDVLAVSSVYITELKKQSYMVRPDGKIALPLFGEVFVAGKTTKEIEAAILDATKKYYRKGDVMVEVTGYNSQKIYVFGQVSRPGPMPWTGCDTVINALAIVQPNQYAWPEKIKILRPRPPKKGGEELPSEEKKEALEASYEATGLTKAGAEEIEIDLTAMMKQGDMSRNILLLPDDVIYVPANPFAAVGLALRMALFPTQPVLEAIRVPYTIKYQTDYFQGQSPYE